MYQANTSCRGLTTLANVRPMPACFPGRLHPRVSGLIVAGVVASRVPAGRQPRSRRTRCALSMAPPRLAAPGLAGSASVPLGRRCMYWINHRAMVPPGGGRGMGRSRSWPPGLIRANGRRLLRLPAVRPISVAAVHRYLFRDHPVRRGAQPAGQAAGGRDGNAVFVQDAAGRQRQRLLVAGQDGLLLLRHRPVHLGVLTARQLPDDPGLQPVLVQFPVLALQARGRPAWSRSRRRPGREDRRPGRSR